MSYKFFSCAVLVLISINANAYKLADFNTKASVIITNNQSDSSDGLEISKSYDSVSECLVTSLKKPSTNAANYTQVEYVKSISECFEKLKKLADVNFRDPRNLLKIKFNGKEYLFFPECRILAVTDANSAAVKEIVTYYGLTEEQCKIGATSAPELSKFLGDNSANNISVVSIVKRTADASSYEKVFSRFVPNASTNEVLNLKLRVKVLEEALAGVNNNVTSTGIQSANNMCLVNAKINNPRKWRSWNCLPKLVTNSNGSGCISGGKSGDNLQVVGKNYLCSSGQWVESAYVPSSSSTSSGSSNSSSSGSGD